MFREHGLEVGRRHPPAGDGVRRRAPRGAVVEERFMQIEQAVGTSVDRAPATVTFLRDLVEELKASGFVADSLARSGQADATVAPPA